MFGMLTKTDPVETFGAELLRTVEGLLAARSISEHHCLMEQLENFAGSDELDGTRFDGLNDAAGDLLAGLGEWSSVMQRLDAEVAKLTGRPQRLPWNKRGDK